MLSGSEYQRMWKVCSAVLVKADMYATSGVQHEIEYFSMFASVCVCVCVITCSLTLYYNKMFNI